jgi:phage terminase large subunit-like protein
MVEGDSGILATAPPGKRPTYEPSKRKLTWPNGASALLFSAEEPERLRGPQCEAFWADEVAAWKYLRETWDQLMFGFRLGASPRGVATTTPKPLPLLRELLSMEGVVVTRGSTYENRDNLSPVFFQQIIARYEGSRLGRQELNAELLEDVEGALWSMGMIDALRRREHPKLTRIVVAIDPAVTSGADSDETGIVVAGLGEDGHGYVLEDLSGRWSPDTWAKKAVGAYRTQKADRIIGEANNGGDLVEVNIRTVDRSAAFKKVHASRGKRTRAEPVAALYEQGKVHHVGGFAELEDQMSQWVPGTGVPSPDRMDALVWALTELMLQNAPTPFAFSA